MKFEVPQFVDVEDRIIGPLTWRQFVFLAGGIGAGIVLFLLLPRWLFFIIGLPFVIFGAGLAFYRVNSRPLAVILEAMTSYFTNARLYLWQRQGVRPQTEQPEVPVAPAPPVTVSGGANGNIASLARKLEVNAIENDITSRIRQ